MFVHNKKLQYIVHVDAPNPAFAKMCLEQFGCPNAELAASMRYFTQGRAESDVARRDMLLDLATEELSHLEMIGQIITFESALAAIEANFPSSNVAPNEKFAHTYFDESMNGAKGSPGFDMVQAQGKVSVSEAR